MKIGILTFHNALNYGALLQTYALQLTLCKLGTDPHVINYCNPAIKTSLHKPIAKDYRNPFKYSNDKRIYENNIKKACKMQKFTDGNIHLTDEIFESDLSQLSDEYDLFFCGSDQIWNETITNDDSHYYLDFVPKQKKCSYAASIGAEIIPEGSLSRLYCHLRNFRAISVREESLKEELRIKLGIAAEKVLDPTILLTEREYLELSNTKKLSLPQNPYILLYMLVYSESLVKSAKAIADKLKLPIVCVNTSSRMIKGIIDKSDAGIEEWLCLFSKAEFVLTNSFHGVAFSINFNKQFNAELLPDSVNANARIKDILRCFTLEDRIINNGRVNTDDIDYDVVNDCLVRLRQKSLSFLKGAIDGDYLPVKQNQQKSILTLGSDFCSGCTYCEVICPVKAITMVTDEKGFKRPHVCVDKCIQCGNCVAKCPFQRRSGENKQKSPIEIYAATSGNEEVKVRSSSGGVYFELANHMQKQNGVVYAAEFDDSFRLHHVRLVKEQSIYGTLGSKYVQSDIDGVLKSISEDLENGLDVLFVGTPCQVAAVKQIGIQHDNHLLLCDLVCHGVPSPKLLTAHLEYCSKYFNSEVSEYYPRVKTMGWGHHELLCFKNGKKECLHPVSQAYKTIFHTNYGIRSSCFNCPFTNFNRVGDLSLADYWGIELSYPELYDKNGVSMVMVNTEKGEKVLNEISTIHLTKTDISSIREEKQPHLWKPLEKKHDDATFWKLFLSKGWKPIIGRYALCSDKAIIKWKLKELIRKNIILNKVYKVIKK